MLIPLRYNSAAQGWKPSILQPVGNTPGKGTHPTQAPWKGKSTVSMIMPFQGAEIGDIIDSQGVTMSYKIEGFQP